MFGNAFITADFGYLGIILAIFAIPSFLMLFMANIIAEFPKPIVIIITVLAAPFFLLKMFIKMLWFEFLILKDFNRGLLKQNYDKHVQYIENFQGVSSDCRKIMYQELNKYCNKTPVR